MNDARTAQQIGVLIIVPIAGLMVAQFSGAVWLTIRMMLVISGGLAGLAALLLLVGATVEEVSVIHHMLGQENWQPRRIARVRTSDGQRITVGLRDEAGPGATIELFQEEQAPFGRAKAK